MSTSLPSIYNPDTLEPYGCISFIITCFNFEVQRTLLISEHIIVAKLSGLYGIFSDSYFSKII